MCDTKMEPSETATRTFWQHMKQVQGKSKQTVIPQLTSNGSTAETDLEKAEMFNKFSARYPVNGQLTVRSARPRVSRHPGSTDLI